MARDAALSAAREQVSVAMREQAQRSARGGRPSGRPSSASRRIRPQGSDEIPLATAPRGAQLPSQRVERGLRDVDARLRTLDTKFQAILH